MFDITEYKNMVWSISLQFHKNKEIKYKYELEDLIQIGYLGLLKAARKFDETKGLKFSTYAFPMIKYEIMKTMRDDKFYPCENRDKRMFSTVDSLDKHNGLFDDHEVTLVDLLTDNTDFTDKSIFCLELENLPENYKQILKSRYYLEKSQCEIAKDLNINQPKVHRLEKKALKHLKQLIS